MNPFMQVEQVLTEEERATFLRQVTAVNPRLNGAKVADVLDIMADNDDSLLLVEQAHDVVPNGFQRGLVSTCVRVVAWSRSNFDEPDFKATDWVKLGMLLQRLEVATLHRLFPEMTWPRDMNILMTKGGPGPVVGLRCCCCGELTRGRQWHNRDTGYGVCSKCVERFRGRKTSEDEIRSLYGVEGVHFSVKE